MTLKTLLLTALLLAGPAPGLLAGSDTHSRQTVIVVVGAPGAAEYEEPFQSWADRWREAAERGQATFVGIGLEPEGETSDRERLHSALAEASATSHEPLWLVLIGHGTFDGKLAKFNLRGPDISADELSAWLQSVSRPLALVNCASASGPFINKLSGPNRVVVSATKSGFELNYARFGDYLSQAIVDPAADLDKDEQTSLLEAFLSAASRTAEFYAQEGRLASEHALVDDNGDGLGTPADWFRGVRAVKTAKDGAAPDGLRSNQLCLVRSQREQGLTPELRQQRDELEREIATLRHAKGQILEREYYARLEQLFLRLARLYEQAEQGGAALHPAPAP